MTRPITSDDVSFALAQIGQATEVAATLFPRSVAADRTTWEAAALLQLWQITGSDDAVDEVLDRLGQRIIPALEQPNCSQVWILLESKIGIAKACIRTYREQQAYIDASRKLIDETGD